MLELGVGFHVRRILIANGSREDEGPVFPQGYSFNQNGLPLPYATIEEARVGKRQILAEGLPQGRELVIYRVSKVE